MKICFFCGKITQDGYVDPKERTICEDCKASKKYGICDVTKEIVIIQNNILTQSS